MHRCHFYNLLRKNKYASAMKYYITHNQYLISVALFSLLIIYLACPSIVCKSSLNGGYLCLLELINGAGETLYHSNIKQY